MEDDELQLVVDEIVGGEDDAPSDRVLAGVGRGGRRQQRERVRVVWRREPKEGEG